MTTADPGQAAPRWGALATHDPSDSHARAAADHDDARAALAAARIDAPGGQAELKSLLHAAAERYAVAILGLAGPGVADLVNVAVARAVRTLPRDLGPDELTDHVHLAVRHEAWRRQRGRTAHLPAPRALAAAAAVLVVFALGVVALSVGRWYDDREPAPEPVVAIGPAATHVLVGRVVDTSAAGTVLGGRAGIEIEVVADGETVRTTRTDEAGAFTVGGLAPDAYQVRVEVPVGNRLRGAGDGHSASVDLTVDPEARLVLQLQRT